jgi:hypothetical protein
VIRLQSRWLTAVTAAAAVLAMIAASALLAAEPSGRPAAPATPAGIGPLPPYYAELGNCRGNANVPRCVFIRNAWTGAVLASAGPPRRNFLDLEITAAADDTMFVIGAVSLKSSLRQPTSFFLARFDPASKTITMRALSIPSLPASAIALSPDGRELAVVVPTYTDGLITSSALRLYSLATGAVRVWTALGIVDSAQGDQGLSWGPGGILAYYWSRNSGHRP